MASGRKAEGKTYRESHREELRVKAKAYRESHKEEIKAHRTAHKKEIKAYRDSHKKEMKAYQLLRNYGLTIEKYNELIAGGCVNCGSHIWLHIDHHHSKPGTYRGVLCQPCNVALGSLRENKQIILGLINYLERNNEDC
jgi:hypothetical protein